MPRLFFALQPQPEQLAAITAAMHPMVLALGAKPVAEADLHMTLFFLGQVKAEAVPGLRTAVAGATSGLFRLALSHVDCWQDSRVLCLLPDETAATQMIQELAQFLAVAACPWGGRHEHQPFRAHVTLARRVPPEASCTQRWPQSLPRALPFTAHGFVLMESSRAPEGQRYNVIHAWPPPRRDV